MRAMRDGNGLTLLSQSVTATKSPAPPTGGADGYQMGTKRCSGRDMTASGHESRHQLLLAVPESRVRLERPSGVTARHLGTPSLVEDYADSACGSVRSRFTSSLFSACT